ncbi:MAG TPA: competence protein TfoX [Chromatiales bacterium]|nr:competence protein TfoX [Thiotrichales bacterium]HIP68816.1 competence protein TfoX [Chromatiales bacterium]
MADRELIKLKNIGLKIASRLNEIGVYSRTDLEQIGAAEAHKQIKRNYPDETLAVCYYLYSFEGAVTDTHWNDIPEKRKQALRQIISEGEQENDY